MIYCDTSLLVALVTPEAHSETADRWMRTQSSDRLVASAWVGTEMASALALKQRTGVLNGPSLMAATQAGERCLAAMADVSIDARHFVEAGRRFVTAPPKGLRAGDALNLAIVVDHGFGLATLDANLATAARRQGIDVVVPITP